MTPITMQSLPMTSHGGEDAVSEPAPMATYYDQTPPSEVVDPEEDVQHLPPIWPGQEPTVAVIGVGYVGEHLVHAFADRGRRVIGFDVSAARIATLQRSSTDTGAAVFTSKPSDLAPATHFLIAVPTLLLPDLQVDSSYLRQALAVVARHARRGSTVVIESSVAVGMTRALLGPLAAERGFFAGMSPERVDPGRSEPPARAIPKVVAGLDDVVPGSGDAIAALYEVAFDSVVRVSRPEVAEMMKLYENCQRMVCIAYANEMADACASHGIDPFEVCRAAATKPFGYLPFAPSLGVGGHCIPVNPFYLFSTDEFPLLQSATDRMRARPALQARRILDTVTRHTSHHRHHRPRVLVVGMGFKAGQAHLANSPGLALARSLVVSGQVEVAWADPLVTQESVPQIARLAEESWTAGFLKENFEYIVAAVRQMGLDFAVLKSLPPNMVEWWFA
ncbi:UDP-glucose dehydrogenase/UDP-mannac dehydrogenase, putative [Cordyceps militaris CM01]|uniref:UDP-glucose dehydrogenase/UDP-mannac dehydrogenase, putative n=1 Tax=Cordyceps militaris (strain CM01) TaxID=983644 RepID=G3JNK1_CORMM|nr:UDP-glucose dehydrogenase/UDP-mannac dehydrogenase, putative [Cordyceps militaris CM01]EGX89841.1 UDP-glucose dehydrogenase/UDP-mannac dehydrogenase, putative [Cordyceps militaris CM01]